MAISQMRSKEKKFLGECERLKQLIDLVRPRNLDALFPVENKTGSNNAFDVNNIQSCSKIDEENVNKTESIADKTESIGDKTESIVEEIKEEKDTPVDESLKMNSHICESKNEIFSTNTKTTPTKTQLKGIIEKNERKYEPAAMPPLDYPKFGLLQKSEALIKNPLQIKSKRQRQQEMDNEVISCSYY